MPKDGKRANLKLTRRRMKDVFSSLFLEDCKRCSEKGIGIGGKSFILLPPPGRRCETMCPSPLKSAQVRRGRGEEGREEWRREREVSLLFRRMASITKSPERKNAIFDSVRRDALR